jgi:CubicO group peptidase (beta-lactamase class C family)
MLKLIIMRAQHRSPRTILAGLLLLLTAAPVALADDWPTTTPADTGFAADLGNRLDAALASGDYEGVHAVVLIRSGKLVYERYLTGDDEILGRRKTGIVFGPDSLHDVRSISKSVVALLYGAALAEGRVPPVEAPVMDAFPEYVDLVKDPSRRAITVGHVLSMTMGTEWSEDLPYSDPRNSERELYSAPDSLRYALDRPLVAKPGERWTYNGGATALLGGMIARGTGQRLDIYARDALFAPLGIEDFEWVSDYYRVPYAASGLRLRPRDMAKLGQLVLQAGRWNGAQVVPAEWIAASTTPRAEAEEGCRYGYQWWLCETASGVKVVEGAGYGGQQLLIVRDLDLVVASNAGKYGDNDAWKLAWGLLENVIIPAAQPR